MDTAAKANLYQETLARIKVLTEGETDRITIMSTVVCELHTSFPYFHWTGFYRKTDAQILRVGPYQGGHGCLSIPFSQGVCGKAAKEELTQLVLDVNELEYHIACSTETMSEIVVPIKDNEGKLIAVFDIDSNVPAAFDDTDRKYLEELSCSIDWGD